MYFSVVVGGIEFYRLICDHCGRALDVDADVVGDLDPMEVAVAVGWIPGGGGAVYCSAGCATAAFDGGRQSPVS